MTPRWSQPPSQRPSFRCRNKGDSISGAFLLLGRAGDFFSYTWRKFMRPFFSTPTCNYVKQICHAS